MNNNNNNSQQQQHQAAQAAGTTNNMHAQQQSMSQQQQQANQQAAVMGNAAMMAPSQVPAHLVGLMTNPAFAAAAAASPLFPPAAMISNPGAFLAMPEAFSNGGMQAVAQNGGQGGNQGVVMPDFGGNMAFAMGNTAGGSKSMNMQQQLGAPVQQQQMSANSAQAAATHGHNMGGLPPPMKPIAPNVKVPPDISSGRSQGGGNGSKKDDSKSGAARTRRTDLTPEERAKQNRDRNREHARSTRMRKKAYIQKLNELVEGLHAERAAEVRQRRVAIQHLAETQNVRRAVVRSFLRYHASYETSQRKWSTLLEDNFWLKQPVTPYRSFRRGEIEQECRMSRGVEAIIEDAASVSVMVEGIGSRCTRWIQIKREDFFIREEAKNGSKHMPRLILRQGIHLKHAISSLSSSSGSSNSSGGEEVAKQNKHRQQTQTIQNKAKLSSPGKSITDAGGHKGKAGPKKVSSSSGSSNESRCNPETSNDFHDYHAQPLPDPKIGDSDGSSPSDDSPEESNNSPGDETKRVSTDSSSGDDSEHHAKRRKIESNAHIHCDTKDRGVSVQSRGNLPPNIAKSGGIAHGVQSLGNGTARLSLAPAIPLPPFAGIGKRTRLPAHGAVPNNAGMGSASGQPQVALSGATATANGDGNESLGSPAIITADVETSSSSSRHQQPQIRAYYHINEDDMILMDDVLMCPFIFRSQDAVLCGALAECVMPGMLRAHFSPRNKLISTEMVYDAMGFMQQLERASGSEGTAQVIPGSLEMALSPSATEARVITLADPPFLIVNVNEAWTRMTKYTQMEVEGKELLSLLHGERTVADAGTRPGKPQHMFDEVANGRSACSTNIHYDKEGQEYVEFVCSYPLTNANGEVTHLLHIGKELPLLQEPEFE